MDSCKPWGDRKVLVEKGREDGYVMHASFLSSGRRRTARDTILGQSAEQRAKRKYVDHVGMSRGWELKERAD